MARAVLLEARSRSILYRRVPRLYRDSRQTTTIRHGAVLWCMPVFWSILKKNYEQWPIIRYEDLLPIGLNRPSLHVMKECPAPYHDMCYVNVRSYECTDYVPAEPPRRNVQLVAR